MALGLSRNPSVIASELLLYLHATLQPFVVAIIHAKDAKKRARGMLFPSARKAKMNNKASKGRTNSGNDGVVKGDEGNDEGEVEESEEEEDGMSDDDYDDELPSYLREQSSDEEDAALYSKKPPQSEGGKFIDLICIVLIYVFKIFGIK